ncbi:MAG: hypothetical protein IJ443_02985, partial [Firmicutes bacterium]|nr:hypothetical protein [Bacillota bacterium]
MRQRLKNWGMRWLTVLLLIVLCTTMASAEEVYGTNTEALAVIKISMEEHEDFVGNILAAASIRETDVRQVMEKARSEGKTNVIFDVTT